MTPDLWAQLTQEQRAAHTAANGPAPAGWAPNAAAAAAYPGPPMRTVRADRNGMGVAGLVLGIVALVFSVIPIIGLIAWFLWPLGLVFALVGITRAKRGEATNRGAATGGLVTSAIAAAMCVLWLFITAGAAATSHPTAGSPGAVVAGAGVHTTSVAAPAAPAKPAGPATTIGDGTYEVGKDLVAGRYNTSGPGGGLIPNCYWARTKDDSGELTAIIANGNAQGPASVTVRPGEFFTTAGGCTWARQ